MSECTPKFLEFVKYVATCDFPYPALKEHFIAQCILECGRGSTKLFADYANPFGMHYHPWMESYAKGVDYEACDGLDVYASFANWSDVIKAYFNWFAHWDHYKGWQSHTSNGLDWLKFIVPNYCPPGNTEAWAKAHGGLKYYDYVDQKLLPEAKELLAKYKEDKPMPIENKDATWFEMNRTDNGKPVCTVYAGDKALYNYNATTIDELFVWSQNFPNAHNLEVANTEKKIIPDVPYWGEKQPEPKPKPPPPPFDKKWPPFMKRSKFNMPVRVTKNPTYFIIHWAASNYNAAAEDIINWGVQQGYTYLCMGRDGKIFQAHPINGGGHHVGTASVDSFDCLGIEVVNVGCPVKVDGKYLPYYAQRSDGSWDMSKALPDDEIIIDKDNESDDESFAGVYQKFTKEQYAGLLKLAVFMVQEWGIEYANIRGHDMVALKKGRKCDPGLAIHPQGMVGFRKEVKAIVDSGKKWRDL